jgi:hypothetical protein
VDSKENKRIRDEWHGGKCSRCGGESGWIVAHHVHPKHDRRGVPSDLSSEKALREELKLCVPLCIPCHMAVHRAMKLVGEPQL